MIHNYQLIILFTSFYLFFYQGECKYCGPTYIRNSIAQMAYLNNCTIVLGNVEIALLDYAKENEWDNLTFPQLREITQNLLIYRAHGLKKLGKLFPNLKIIRGYKVVYDYSLIVSDNSNLVEVELPSLVSILRGYVRIQRNERLCFTNLTNWSRITNGNYNVVEDGKNEICNNKSIPKIPRNCNRCMNQKCYDENECSTLKNNINCHEYCFGGCTEPNNPRACITCKYFNDYGNCVEECPDGRFKYDNYFCSTEQDCKNLRGIPFMGKCLEKCPPNYKKILDNEGYCKKCSTDNCRFCNVDGHVLKDMNTIQALKGCEILNGTLTIRQIKTEQTKKELYEVLGLVREIRGGLYILKNDLITSLYFFQRLTDIYGKENGSIVVHDNSNLKRLFAWHVTKNLKVHNGKLRFFNNPKLCLSEIEYLRGQTKVQYNYTEADVSPVTNADETSCEHDFLINATTIEINSNFATIEWTSYSPPSTHIVSAYEILYEITELINITTSFSEIEPCENFKKETVIISQDVNAHFEYLNITLTNLRPYTTYSYFITALISQITPTVNTLHDIRAKSKINKFTTYSDQPSRPQNVQALNLSHSQIQLKWKAPEQPNGKLTKYVITAYLQQDEKESIDRRDYCLAPKIPEHEQTQRLYDGLEKDCENVEIDLILCNDINCETTSENNVVNGCQYFESSKYKIDFTNEKSTIKHPFGSLDLTKRDLTTTIDDVQEQMKRLSTGEYEIFSKTVTANNHELIIDNLRHYSIYLIYISACNEGVTIELCSTVEMIAQRTNAKPQADDIEAIVVNKDNNMITDIYWPEPKHPNCIILYYTIEIIPVNHVVETERFQYCVTRREHQQEKYKFKLNRLPDGLYNVRVRATSLAGEGNWTDYMTSRVTTARWNLFHQYGFIFILLFVSVSLFVLWKIFKYKDKQKRHTVNRIISALHNFEISRDDIRLEHKVWDLRMDTNPKSKLFAHIFQGTFQQNICFFKVSTNESAILEEKKSFFHNTNIFCNSDNDFVAKIFGIVSNTIPYILAFEYAEEGLLHDYLKKCFKQKKQIPKKYMYQWAAEIADGMAYLASKNYIHSDLATRNILLTSTFTTKITNFQLGRGTTPENYVKLSQRHNEQLPIRWLSKELLLNNTNKSSNLSDVWSYGILLWEIANCCRLEKPYSTLTDVELMTFLKNHGVLEPPFDMPFLLSKIMRKCFNDEINRPTFEQIVLLDTATLNNFHEKSFVFKNKTTNLDNSRIELHPARSLAKINFEMYNPNNDNCSISSNDQVRLIRSKNTSDDISSTDPLNNASIDNNLNDFFNITPEDWNEWIQAKMSEETLTSFGIDY